MRTFLRPNKLARRYTSIVPKISISPNHAFPQQVLEPPPLKPYSKLLSRPQWSHISEFSAKLEHNDLQEARDLMTKAFNRYQSENPRIIQIMLLQFLNHQLNSSAGAFNLILLSEVYGDYEPQCRGDIELILVQRKVDLMFFLCFLQLSIDLQGNISEEMELALHQKIKDLATEYQLQTFELSNILTTPERKEAYSRIVGSGNELHKQDEVSSDPMLDNGTLLPLNELCDYIRKMRFTDYDSNEKLPMYEIYESLSKEDQIIFMKNYKKHNMFREVVIEQRSKVLKPTKSSNSREQEYTNALFNQWVSQIVDGIEELVSQLLEIPFDARKQDIPSHLLPVHHLTLVIKSMPQKIVAEILLSQLLSKCTTASKYEPATVTSLCRSLASSFDWIGTFSSSSTILGSTLTLEERISIIGTLLDVVIRKCSFTMNGNNASKPVFHYWLSLSPPSEKLKTVGAIKVDSYLKPKLQDTLWSSKSMNIKFPMLVPPKPWSSPNNGGYVGQQSSFLLLSHAEGKLHPFIFNAHENHDLDNTYKVLNNLGSVPWTVNPNMIQVLNKALTYPKGFMNITPKPEYIPRVILPDPQRDDFESEIAYKLALKTVHAKNADAHKEYIALVNLREQFETTAMIAQAYGANGDMIFFPHGVDFRGRTYPFPTPLNHHSQDAVRSLLMMWTAKPLGSKGFEWIKYHLGAMYGLVLPFDKRVLYVESHIEDILDSARNPFNGRGWWKNGQKPFQTLSLCFEVASIMDFISKGNKAADYPCRIMVHLDGSCNGLQHYSALGRDIEGGKAVNLIPGDITNELRGDIYETVRDTVSKKFIGLLHDSTLLPQERDLTALSLSILNRKMVKQTVMTSVYGITDYGARHQIMKRISELLDQIEFKEREGVYADIDAEKIRTHKFELAFQIANATLDSIDELFSNAKRIENWLKENCFRVLTSFSLRRYRYPNSKVRELSPFIDAKFFLPFIWYTYTRFMVIQDYRTKNTIDVPSALQLITLHSDSPTSPINVRKHMNSIPPNFVHSLDSSHLALTCLAASDANVTFAAVHDSFWTYPSQAEDLGQILRQKFVELHSSDILETLVADLKAYTEDSYQLVWVSNKDNAELVKAIREIRLSEKTIGTGMEQLDTALTREFNNLRLSMPNSEEITPTTLVEVYDPKVYIRTTLKTLKQYNGEVDNPRVEFSIEKFTPVFIPIRILEAPSQGNLDINDVLQSKYFFS